MTDAATATKVVSLYQSSRKIYAKSVKGQFATWRIAMVINTQAVFYGLAWLPWNDRQAVLFDLTARKFYVFGWVFWPQDVLYLTFLLIVSAYGLFFVTAIAGRVFCGYACPQTVYTQVFMWVENWFEGDRASRMRLDQAPWTRVKFARKLGKHAVWVAIALWTGFTFVGYFTPIRVLFDQVLSFTASPWESFWMLFYAFATWGNAGFMREQVCKYMCPYARFQGVMFDRDTLIVSYDAARGEPRGGRKRGADLATLNLGTCVDCSLCVQVCPTGIDIRNGLQYECIGCSACIDACDPVMDKMQYPRGLIRYSTENALTHRWDAKAIRAHLIRPRIAIYSLVLIALVSAFVASLLLRNPLKVDVIRDRRALAREIDGQYIENVYRLNVMNAIESQQTLRVSAKGIQGIKVDRGAQIEASAASVAGSVVAVRVPIEQVKPGSHTIHFIVTSLTDPSIRTRENAVFYVPK